MNENILAWINEDELPENYPYDAMFPYSKVDFVRMFPVYGPLPAESDKEAVRNSALEECAAYVLQVSELDGGISLADDIRKLKSQPAQPSDTELSAQDKFVVIQTLIPALKKAGVTVTGSVKEGWKVKVSPTQPSDDKWRDLALQFDGHRMQAIGWLKVAVELLPDHVAAPIKDFLKAPPLSGEKVLADRVATMAQPSDTEIVESFQDAIDAYQDPNQSWGISREYAIATVRSIKAAMRAEWEGK